MSGLDYFISARGSDFSYSCKHGLAMNFLRGRFWLPAVSLPRQRHDILHFSCCPLSHVLHVTLANLQKFEFEFHLRSSPSAFCGWSLLATPCWRDTTRSKQLSTVAILGFLFRYYNVFYLVISIASLLRFQPASLLCSLISSGTEDGKWTCTRFTSKRSAH